MGGDIIFSGESPVTSRGVCWSTSHNPTIADNHTNDGGGFGVFTSNLTGLNDITTYYVRAYATNSYGISYGEEVVFVTTNSNDGQPCQGTPTVLDYDQNIYNTVQIGHQCWMKDNLRTTHYANGASIALGTSISSTTAYCYNPNNSSSTVNTYGYLYNWTAVMRGANSSNENPSGVQGICPNGWHVPSDAEWEQLSEYVGSRAQYQCDGNSEYIAKALASTVGWETSTTDCAVGNNSASNNSTGFSALPAGYCSGYGESLNYSNFGGSGCFWTTRAFSGGRIYRGLQSNNKYLGWNVDYSGSGSNAYSVRCIRSMYTGEPIVTTAAVTEVTASKAIAGGEVVSDGNTEITGVGLCWSTSHNPTIADSHSSVNVDFGVFTGTMTNLSDSTTYYYRAYISNNQGTYYGNELSFTTLPTPQDGQTCAVGVTDYDGNSYNTVQIGNQCWMKENMRTTHYADGTALQQMTSSSSTTGAGYYQPSNTYGLLYNHSSLRGVSSTNPSGVQSVCPEGWHVPSQAEWYQLIDYVSLRPEYRCGYTMSNVAKALASQSGWNTSSVACAVGNNQSINNTTGFNAMPSGSYGGGSNLSGAVFWSTTSIPVGENYYQKYPLFNLTYNSATPDIVEVLSYNSFYSCYAIRCVSDEVGEVDTTTTAEGSIIVSFNGSTWVAANMKAVDHSDQGYLAVTIEKTTGCSSDNSDIYLQGYIASSVGSWTYQSSNGDYLAYMDPSYIYTDANGDLGDAGSQYWGWNAKTSSSSENITYIDICNSRISGVFTEDIFDIVDYIAAGNTIPTNTHPLTVTMRNAYWTWTDASYSPNSIPTVEIVSINNVTSSSATVVGDVTFGGCSIVTSCGVCWNTIGNPTLQDSHTTLVASSGTFVNNLSNLLENMTYYVRVYATNSDGTGYSDEMQFTTLSSTLPDSTQMGDDFSCPGTPTVADFDENSYNTVKIGDQCWMRENLRTTHYADGTEIVLGVESYVVDTFPCRRAPNNDISNVAVYGYLYNWPAVMHGANSSSTNPSLVQGICPNGWHVPSNAEWTELTNYVKNQSQYVCSGNSLNIAMALAATTGWQYCPSTCAVGDDRNANNATRFSVVPSGSYFGDYTSFGYSANLWSTTQSNILNFGYCSSSVNRSYDDIYSCNSVRCLRNETTPTVTTSAATNVTQATATLNGIITNPYNVTIQEQGFEWKPVSAPDYSAVNATGTTMTYNLTGLTMNTAYTYRAYAITAVGTVYGEDVMFSTLAVANPDSIQLGGGQPCPGMPSVTDIDGNTYNTVQIGNQCWMKSNLRTTRYADGTTISMGTSTSTTTPYRYAPNNDTNSVAILGYLYNWTAAMQGANPSSTNPSLVRGACPVGWHLPSYAEWLQLRDYVADQSEYLCGDTVTNIAKALASPTGWNASTITCAVGNDQRSNNATGFSAIPVGFYYNTYGNIGSKTFFWSSTEYNTNNSSLVGLNFDSPNLGYYYGNKGNGMSLRCIHDMGETSYTVPTVTTGQVSNVTASTAVCGGSVISDGGTTVTARGVCWSVYQHPTVSNNHTTDGSGMGDFTSNITGLIAGVTYYVRAYATSSAGIAYGSEESFTTEGSSSIQTCPGAATVTDYDGNVYNTVLIGNQCWMRENLKTTRYADGTIIGMGTSTSTTIPYRYAPNNDTSNVSIYGYLYNWKAVMRNSSSSYSNPSGVLGVCPTGWHVPSDAEWIVLTNFVSSQSEYVCGSGNSNIAKSLASITGWDSSTSDCAVGNNPLSNNVTGFSALPAGLYSGSYSPLGRVADFWSATGSGNIAYERYINYNNATVNDFDDSKYYALSVRCVRD